MSVYDNAWIDREGERIHQLRDNLRDVEVDFVTTFGMNVIRFVSKGKDVLLQPPSLSILRQTPFRYGLPMLSPPGRTSYGKFSYRGKDYQLPISVGKHNVHGEIGTVPWEVIQWGEDADKGAFLQAGYSYKKDPERFAYFPFDLEYLVTYRLKEGKLHLEGSVRNAGLGFAPFSLGYHPYFSHSHNHASLQIPASSQWSIDGVGRASVLPKVTRLSEQLRQGKDLTKLEGNLHYLQCSDFHSVREQSYTCLLTDRGFDRRIHYQMDGLFSVMVLFIPPWGDAVSLEPHTCIPDAYNLPWEASQTGILELAPGEEKQFGWLIEVENNISARGGELL